MTTIKALSDDEHELLQAWRAEALLEMPYMASILMALRPVNAPGLGTFACDQQYRLYIDFEAVASWSAALCAQALLHECSHLFADHFYRAENTACVADHERRQWGIAADAEINDDLRDAGCDELAAMGVLPGKLNEPDYLTAEQYMESLRKQQPQQPPKSPQGSRNGLGGQQQGQQQGNGQPQGQGDGQGQGQQDNGQGQQPGQGNGKGKGYRGCGSASGGEAAPCELPADDDANGIAPPASAVEHERNRIATAATVRDYAMRGRGTVPGGLVQIAEQVLAPSKVPWRTVLSAAVKRAVAIRSGDYDSTYLRRHRRVPRVVLSPNRSVIRPGTFEPKPTLAVVRDTSGSMGADEINAVTIEVEAIAKQLGIRGKDLRVMDVDAAVHVVRDYNRAASIAEVTGRGGTDMCVGIEAAAELKPRPHAIVVITDGYTPWPAERIGIPIVACLVGDGAASVKEHVPQWIIPVVVED